jgi:endoglucanase
MRLFGMLGGWASVLTALVLAGEPAFGAEVKKGEGNSSWLPLPLKVIGNQLLNSRNQLVVLRGVNIPDLQWNGGGQRRILQSVNTAMRDWHVNIIRLPLVEDFWFGKAPAQRDGGAAYRALVSQAVEACATHGCYVMVDLHWWDCGKMGTNISEHYMPSLNSVEFWKSCAAQFKNHPAVLFDLYNEPRAVSWSVWRDGGLVKENSPTPTPEYQAAGLQTLLNAVRSTGARNVVIAGGLDWAYDLSGILDGMELHDTSGDGVIYANHTYIWKGDTPEQWRAKMEKVAARFPLIVSEFGGSGGPNRKPMQSVSRVNDNRDDWLLHTLQILQDHNWSWVAWCFHPKAGPPMLSDWNYTPTPDFGIFVKQALAGELPRYISPTE